MLIALLSDPLIRHMGNQEVDDMTAEKVEAAKRKSANFDYSTVKMLNPVSVSLDAVQNAAQNAIQRAMLLNMRRSAKLRFLMCRFDYPLGKDWAIRSCHEVPAPCRRSTDGQGQLCHGWALYDEYADSVFTFKTGAGGRHDLPYGHESLPLPYLQQTDRPQNEVEVLRDVPGKKWSH